MKPKPLSRRAFVVQSSAALAATGLVPRLPAADAVAGPHQAQATRAGEATDTTAIVWTRLTAAPTRNNSGVVISGRARDKKKGEPAPKLTVPVEQLEGACPGAPGRVRLRYGTRDDLRDAATTEWADVSEAGDFIHQFRLRGLTPGTDYHFASESAAPGSARVTSTSRGRFATAPAASSPGNFRFCVMTCQGYPDRGHPDGHDIYPSMGALEPKFTCLTGDLVYYDSNEPRAVTPRLARYHWERMFSLPRLVEFNRHFGTYWLKDDHDTVTNDSWPGMKAGELTFAEGLKIFRQQAPLRDDGPTYRTVRWGRDLQVWFTEGRDFRSPNTMPDGPDKTIWGAEQKAWFKRTVKESNATWKVLVSPTPLVGPDRATGKNDNHSNKGFQHEGDEIRRWLQANAPDNFFVMCGDRHWQYHSVHPETGVQEFSAGAASDEHAGGTPGENPSYHKFHRVKGGFLSVTLKREGARSTILFEHRDVKGQVVYAWNHKAEVA